MRRATGITLLGLRAAALGGVATIGGLFGHLHAGGSDPGVVDVVLIWSVVSLLAAAFLRRPAGWLRIVGLLLAEQLLVHVGLMAFTPMAMVPSMPGMAMSGMSGMPGMSMHAGMPSMGMLPSVGMVEMHAVAALVAGLWLWRGECAVWSLVALARTTVRAWFAAAAVTPPIFDQRPSSRRDDRFEPLWAMRLAHEVTRRGPPAFATI